EFLVARLEARLAAQDGRLAAQARQMALKDRVLIDQKDRIADLEEPSRTPTFAPSARPPRCYRPTWMDMRWLVSSCTVWPGWKVTRVSGCISAWRGVGPR
ncbi:MAG: hypothetical protein ACRD0J_06070, partial [Acidimicrobiales bacterium]